jgi:hypothetical protein
VLSINPTVTASSLQAGAACQSSGDAQTATELAEVPPQEDTGIARACLVILARARIGGGPGPAHRRKHSPTASCSHGGTAPRSLLTLVRGAYAREFQLILTSRAFSTLPGFGAQLPPVGPPPHVRCVPRRAVRLGPLVDRARQQARIAQAPQIAICLRCTLIHA